MNLKAMNLFLSKDNIKRHLEHLRTFKHRLSILEKSLPELKGKAANDIIRSRLEGDVKEEALRLIWYIKSHECFFDSFSECPGRSEAVIKAYSSREKFVYELYLEAMKRDFGFLHVYLDGAVPKYIFMSDFDRSFLKFQPLLVIDLCEHSYFSDYGFAKDKYVRSALMYLDTGKLN